MEHSTSHALGANRIFSGNIRMIIPAGGSHVRQTEIRLPPLAAPPAITATIFTQDGPGTIFGIYHISANWKIGQIVISAANTQSGVPVPYDFWCSYIIVGQPA